MIFNAIYPNFIYPYKYLLFNNIKKKSTHLFTNFIRLYEKLYHRYEKTDQVLLFENGIVYVTYYRVLKQNPTIKVVYHI